MSVSTRAYGILLMYHFVVRFPRSRLGVVVDRLEILYLAGFALLQTFTTLIPALAYIKASTSTVLTPQSMPQATNISCVEGDLLCVSPATGDTARSDAVASMEFLPLMLTSVYCSVGLLWAFLRLSALYLKGKL